MKARPREIAVVSGKGGTGKTSLTAAFAARAGRVVLADCDVDAPDLHLLLAPGIRRREPFLCGHQAVIRQEDCIGCGACLARCRYEAVLRLTGEAARRRYAAEHGSCEDCDFCRRACPVRTADLVEAMREASGVTEEERFFIDPAACEGCGVCVDACPVGAIDFPERRAGEWFVSDTARGPMVHAKLEPGGENSGKLVARVREAARTVAAEQGIGRVLVDGPPGIGCPVIASVTGASGVLVVAEPTVSGAHDTDRILGLVSHFGVPAAVCVNKWDIHPEMAAAIERAAERAGAAVAGRIRYDRAFTAAQLAGEPLTGGDGAASDIDALWARIAGHFALAGEARV